MYTITLNNVDSTPQNIILSSHSSLAETKIIIQKYTDILFFEYLYTKTMILDLKDYGISVTDEELEFYYNIKSKKYNFFHDFTIMNKYFDIFCIISKKIINKKQSDFFHFINVFKGYFSY
jgi:hypothetical protein